MQVKVYFDEALEQRLWCSKIDNAFFTTMDHPFVSKPYCVK